MPLLLQTGYAEHKDLVVVVMVVETSKGPMAGAALTIRPVGRNRWQSIVTACHEATGQVQDVLQQYWGCPIEVKLFGLSTQEHYFWRMDHYHVSQLTLNDTGEDSAAVRLSEAACGALLHQVLGSNSPSNRMFELRRISTLEAMILSDLSRELITTLMKSLIRKSSARKGGQPTVHITWMVQVGARREPAVPDISAKEASNALAFTEHAELGKLVLSVPLNVLPKSPASPEEEGPEWQIVDDFFEHVEVPARLCLGSTRMPLSDLNQLEAGDMVILEHSSREQMGLIHPQTGEIMFSPVSIADTQRFEVRHLQEYVQMEQQMSSPRSNLWDNLMIDVGAEFAPVKLPLKQLKQMSEGLVIELGDLVHNEIRLQVEGKTLAHGELIIVGDKFGVRISRLEAETQMLGQSQGMAAALPVPVADESLGMPDGEQMAENTEENADDDFLGSDFDEEGFDEEDW